MDEQTPPTAEPAAPAAPAPDSLDALLSIYDSSTQAPPSSETAPAPQPVQHEPGHAPARVDPTAPALPANLRNDDLLTVMQSINDIESRDLARQRQAVNAADSAAVLKMAKDTLGDMPTPDGFAERWLVAEYNMNPELQQAWDNRFSSGEAGEACKKLVGAALKRLAASARSMPDRDATEDRNAVTQAVRGSNTRAPENRPPSYGRMTNAEFEAEKAKLYG